MVDPEKVNMNSLPKKLIDGAVGAYGKEIFFYALTSGNNLDSFASTPQVAKSIAIWMMKQVENYEKQFGDIDMSPQAVQSPIQIADLGNGKKE